MTALTGIRSMLALTLRRERVHGTAWYGLVGLLFALIAIGIVSTYPTEAARLELARSVDSSAGERFLLGPLSDASVGAVAVWRMLGPAAILTSLASIFTVVRNTRAAEESGTSELLGTAAVGRAAPLAVAFAVAVGGSLLTGLIACTGFISLGAPLVGTVLAGAQVVCYGILAASIAGLAGQIVSTAHTATGISVGMIALFYVLRGVADVIGGAAYWVSPFAWVISARPFVDDAVLTLLPAIILSAILGIGALRIAAGRDLGAGLLPDRAGPDHAGRALRGPISLALRMSRATIIGWAAGAVVLGVLIGAISSTVNEQIDLELGGEGGGGAGLISVALYLSPLFAAALGLQTVLRLREEVTSGRVETVLSRPVHRAHWLIAHSVAGASASFAVLLAFGLGLGIASAGVDSDPGAIVTLVAAAVLRAPAAWIFVGIATGLLATVPRASAAIGFTLLGAFLLLELLVEFRLIPAEALYASPFALVPQLPAGPPHAAQALLILLVAIALTVSGARSVRNLDIRP